MNYMNMFLLYYSAALAASEVNKTYKLMPHHSKARCTKTFESLGRTLRTTTRLTRAGQQLLANNSDLAISGRQPSAIGADTYWIKEKADCIAPLRSVALSANWTAAWRQRDRDECDFNSRSTFAVLTTSAQPSDHSRVTTGDRLYAARQYNALIVVRNNQH